MVKDVVPGESDGVDRTGSIYVLQHGLALFWVRNYIKGNSL